MVTIYGLVDNTAYAHAFLGGLDLLSTPPDRLRFDRPDIAAALERVAGLVNSGAFYHWPLIQDVNRDAVEQLVRDQKAGMWRADFTSPKGGGSAPTFVGSSGPSWQWEGWRKRDTQRRLCCRSSRDSVFQPTRAGARWSKT